MTTHSPAAIAFGVEANDRITPRRWQERAACRSLPPELFFPIGATGSAAVEIATATQICATCDVRSECLDYALRTNQEFGIWGGLDENDRRRFRQRHPQVPDRRQTVQRTNIVVPPATSGR
jgi:WhiB family redox-sensing transcriptional regulator